MKFTEREKLALQVREVRRNVGVRVPTVLECLLNNGVPDEIAKLAAGEVETTDAVRLAGELVAGDRELLVLAGPVGRGKSIAAAVGMAARQGFGLWVHSAVLSRVPQEETFPDEAWANTGYLVLDDVGSEHSPSGYAAGRLREQVIRRHAAGLPTCITTNLPAKEFLERYDEHGRIASRLGKAGFQGITGRDFRRRA